ncbi:MAG: hypothetical protein JNL01_10845 [Bdellovibrionales bacterium]|nr:hypothetical protein [Bdellovibrionales bacterium]
MKIKLFAIVALAGSSSAWASENANLLSVGAGVSSPSVNTSIGENPAGLVNNEAPKFLVAVQSPSTSFNPMGYGGTFLTGNGRVGAGVGYSNSGAQGSKGGMNFGLAGEITSIKTAIGLAGSYGMDAGPNRAGLDLGLMINSHGPFRVGAVAYGLTGGVDAYGAGLSYEMNANAKLVFDAAADSTFNGTSVKPALGITVQDFQMAVGYGMDVSNGGASVIANGASFALGYAVGRTVHFQFYYNQLAQIYAGLMFRF